MPRREAVLKPFQEESEFLRTRTERDIARYRKGQAVVKLVDRDGHAVSGASVHVRLVKHAFRFGCNLFLLDEICDPEKNERYKAQIARCFNQATLPFYWKDLEPQEGKPRFAIGSPPIYRRPVPDLCLQWCRENGITPKAHCLNYFDESPDWVLQAPDRFWERVERRFQQLSDRYAGAIPCWEVTNETLKFHSHKNFSMGTTPFYDRDFVERSFALAETYFPQNELVINEAHFNVWGEWFKENRSAYYMQIERALLKGARIDAIGLQYHMFYPRQSEAEDTKFYYDPHTLFQLMDRYGDFGKPLQITEITVPAFSDHPEDEAIQAELLTHLYKIWFSHPNMEMITYWNMMDGYAWSEDNVPGNMTSGENLYYGGLLRFDGSPKPAYQAIHDLIHHQWHTEAQLTPDRSGLAQFCGFYGSYEITVCKDGKKTQHTVDFTPNSSPLQITVF